MWHFKLLSSIVPYTVQVYILIIKLVVLNTRGKNTVLAILITKLKGKQVL